MAEFTRIASLAEIPPGSAIAVDAGGRTLALYNVEGTVYATANACLHRGGSLGEGKLAGRVVTCPLHGWQFDVSTGKHTISPNLGVATYEVRIEGDDVLVRLGA